MEERPVLVVGEGVVDLLIPQDAAVGGGEVDDFHPEGVADEVVGEDRGALEAGVGPIGCGWGRRCRVWRRRRRGFYWRLWGRCV